MKRVLFALGVAVAVCTAATGPILANPRGGNSDNAPGHDPSGPGNSENAPGHDPSGPGNSENAPGHNPSGPGNSANAPGHDQRARGQRRAAAKSNALGGAAFSLPAGLLPIIVCEAAGVGGCTTHLAGDGPSELAARAFASPGAAQEGSLAGAIACREGIVRAASSYRATRVDTFSVGEAQTVAGGRIVPLFVRIVYPTATGHEVREARVSCRLDESGTAVALVS